MNKTAIKNFAIWSRVNLIDAAKQKAYEYEITKDGANNKALEAIGGRLLTAEEKAQRAALIDEIAKKGFDQVMEEAAYTWFNRFIALRYMEVNGYLPSRIRVFTNEEGEFKPEIMKEAMTVEIEGLDREKVFDLLEKQNNEELYKYLLITQCNALGEGLPKMFEKIAHWTELLFPANLLRSDSVISKMVSEIPEEDFTDAVQIIGWLYQYYNTELKDDTFAKLKKNIKISKERIPAATQLFTPDWIVRYMVENSLGRIYVNEQISSLGEMGEADRVEKEKAIAEEMGWRYYLPEAEQTPEVRAELNKLTTDHYSLTTLKVIDPCMGSGHILVYAFDVLMQMYTASGWSERDAAKAIVENNLYGLDIDDRAGQLAYFAVMMKARKYNRRALAGGAAGVIPNVYAIQESNHISAMAIDDFCNGDAKVKAEMDKLMVQMRDAKEYGSILNIKDIDFDLLFTRCDKCADEIHFHQNEINEDIIPLIKIAYAMAQKYDVAITNPPYMGGSGMSAKLCEFAKKNYPDSKSDMFAIFIERCAAMLNKNGYQAMITQHAWMFLSSFEKLRRKLNSSRIINMAHLGARAFEEIGGEIVQTTTFVIGKARLTKYVSRFVRLVEEVGQSEKENKFLDSISKCDFYDRSVADLNGIPGIPIAYWTSSAMIDAFMAQEKVEDYSISPSQNVTGNNDKYLRFFWELNKTDITNPDKWIFYAKGGGYRKWYGNLIDVVDWTPSARRQYAEGHACQIIKEEYWYKKAITWCLICTGAPSFRILTEGGTFDKGGSSIIVKDDNFNYVLALLNSKIVHRMVQIYNPTIHYQVRDIRNIPLLFSDSKKKVDLLSDSCVSESKADWDSFETSWDFKKHPLV